MDKDKPHRRSTKSNQRLPTPPPPPKQCDAKSRPDVFSRLLDYKSNEALLKKSLNEAIDSDCKKLHSGDQQAAMSDCGEAVGEPGKSEADLLREECDNFIEPLLARTGSSISAALVAYDAIEQLSRLHYILEEMLTVQEQNYKMSRYLKDVQALFDLKKIRDKSPKENPPNTDVSDCENDLENNSSMFSTIVASGENAFAKRINSKRQRERSKSVIVDDLQMFIEKDAKVAQPRRQSAYSEGKSKVSKWTKVKAAFKWERANVPALAEDKQSESMSSYIGLQPLNHEVAKYLRVPSISGAGGSSADSILSTSSGHLLTSSVGTPGSMSSASSYDDIIDCVEDIGGNKSSSSYENRRKSINSDSTFMSEQERKRKPLVSCSETESKSSVIKVPSQPVEIKKRTKLPPSPLNFSVKHDFSDAEISDLGHSPNFLTKSPTECISPSKRVITPGNSSVPSSPSRFSVFFAESEDFSSGEFSEPTSPHIKSKEDYLLKQQQINEKYNELRDKLNQEFEKKRQEWDKIRSACCTGVTCGFHLVNKDDFVAHSSKTTMEHKMLEENLTADFKKKLQKWRVKKQASMQASHSPKDGSFGLSHKDTEPKKIDWNLWKTGQLKLDGQGLSPMPDQKNLPEEFQKKLDQWNKMKGSHSMSGYNTDSIKRSCKAKVTDKFDKDKRRDRDKVKTPDKDKLSKLKSIVSDQKAREIEVQTSIGVMKFEGISRKFTRKLYEWEKAKGIGPESSTFALLHPGYRPIGVGMVNKESTTHESSPTMSRSFSLDSICHNTVPPPISHQASSLSLNDISDLQDGSKPSDLISLSKSECEQKDKEEEPEAMIVEVEDEIIDTASSLFTMSPVPEQQKAIYKYQEIGCNNYCNKVELDNGKQEIEALIEETESVLNMFSQCEAAVDQDDKMQIMERIITSVKEFSPRLAICKKQRRPEEQDLVDKVKDIVKVISNEMKLAASAEEEACCEETFQENKRSLRKKFEILRKYLTVVHTNLKEHSTFHESIPQINIICEEDTDRKNAVVQSGPIFYQSEIVVNKPQVLIGRELDESSPKPNGKKKLRRKMGSRQNSKSEHDSSEEENAKEVQRRVKHKPLRYKQRSFEEKYSDAAASANANPPQEMLYVLKIKPEQEQANSAESKALISPVPTCVELVSASSENVSNVDNIFVKTRRNVYLPLEDVNSTSAPAPMEVQTATLHLPPKPTKEMSPVIQNLVAMYNKNLPEDKPFARIRRRPEPGKIAKSVSLGNVEKEARLAIEKTSSCDEICVPRAGSPRKSSSLSVLYKDEASSSNESRSHNVTERKSSLFRKNDKKVTSLFGKTGATAKKIELHNAREKLDKDRFEVSHLISGEYNTLPKLRRKSDNSSGTSIMCISLVSDNATSSAPTTPLEFPGVVHSSSNLSARALKLKKAKEEFLREPHYKPSLSRSENRIDLKQHRISQVSMSSETSGDECNLPKSASVGMISSIMQSMPQLERFNSLHPSISRSSKFTSKLGFVNLASKFRRAKLKRNSKEIPKMEAVSILCRQSLAVDFKDNQQAPEANVVNVVNRKESCV